MNTTPIQTISIAQGTPEWLALRRRYRTASETPVVMGLSPWQTREQLAAQKWNGAPACDQSAAPLVHGRTNEPLARAAFEAKSGKPFPPAVLLRGDYLASLDGLSADGTELLEVKCPTRGAASRTWQAAEFGVLERHYAAQVQHQLMVSGCRVAHFWVFDSETRAGLLVDVAPDERWHEEIRRWWAWFCEEFQMKQKGYSDQMIECHRSMSVSDLSSKVENGIPLALSQERIVMSLEADFLWL